MTKIQFFSFLLFLFLVNPGKGVRINVKFQSESNNLESPNENKSQDNPNEVEKPKQTTTDVSQPQTNTQNEGKCLQVGENCGVYHDFSVPGLCCDSTYCLKGVNVCKEKKAIGVSCFENIECLSGNCFISSEGLVCQPKAGECKNIKGACKADTECCYGLTCKSQSCIECQKNTQSCSTNDDCCSGNCFFDPSGNSVQCQPLGENCLKEGGNCKKYLENDLIKRVCCKEFFCDSGSDKCMLLKENGIACLLDNECKSSHCTNKVCGNAKLFLTTSLSKKKEEDECDNSQKKFCEEGLVCYNSKCKKACKLDFESCDSATATDPTCCSGFCYFKLGVGTSPSGLMCSSSEDLQKENGKCLYLNGNTSPKCASGLFCLGVGKDFACRKSFPNNHVCQNDNQCFSGNCFWDSDGSQLICQDPEIRTIPDKASCLASNSPIQKVCQSGRCCKGLCSNLLNNKEPCTANENCCSKRCDFNALGEKVCMDPSEKNCADIGQKCQFKKEGDKMFPSCCEELTCFEFSCQKCSQNGASCKQHDQCCSKNCFYSDDGSEKVCSPKGKAFLEKDSICTKAENVCKFGLICYNGKCQDCGKDDNDFCKEDKECCTQKCVYNEMGMKVCGFDHNLVKQPGAPCQLETINNILMPVCNSNLKLYCQSHKCSECINNSQETCKDASDCCSNICGHQEFGKHRVCKNPGEPNCILENGSCDVGAKGQTFQSDPRICCKGVCFGPEGSKSCRSDCLDNGEVVSEGTKCCSEISGYEKEKAKVCLAKAKTFQDVGEVCNIEQSSPTCKIGLYCADDQTCRKCLADGDQNCDAKACCNGLCDEQNVCRIGNPVFAAKEKKSGEKKIAMAKKIKCLSQGNICDSEERIRCCENYACASKDGKCTECAKNNEVCNEEKPCCSDLQCNNEGKCESITCPNTGATCSGVQDCCSGLFCNSRTGLCSLPVNTNCRADKSPCDSQNLCCENQYLICVKNAGEEGFCQRSLRLQLIEHKRKLLLADSNKKKLLKKTQIRKASFTALHHSTKGKAVDDPPKASENAKTGDSTDPKPQSGADAKNSQNTEATESVSVDIKEVLSPQEIYRFDVPEIVDFLSKPQTIDLKDPKAQKPVCLTKAKKCKINLPLSKEIKNQLEEIYLRYVQYEKTGQDPKKISIQQLPPLEIKDEKGNIIQSPPNVPSAPSIDQNKDANAQNNDPATAYLRDFDIGFGVKIPFAISKVLGLISKSKIAEFEAKLGKYLPDDPPTNIASADPNAQNKANPVSNGVQPFNAFDFALEPCCSNTECQRMEKTDYAVCVPKECISPDAECLDSTKPCCDDLKCLWDKLGKKKRCRNPNSNPGACIGILGLCDEKERTCCPGKKCVNGQCHEDCLTSGDCNPEENKCCGNFPCDPKTLKCTRKPCSEDGNDCSFLQCCSGYYCGEDRICRFANPPSSPVTLYKPQLVKLDSD